MKIKLPVCLLILLFGSATTDLEAQLLPFFTDTALTVGFESNAVRIFGRFAGRRGLRKEGQELADPFDRDLLVFTQVFAVPVRLNPDTVFTAVVPVLHKQLSLTSGSSPRAMADGGLGDITLLVKHRFYQDDFTGGGLQAAFLAGVKLPSGDDKKRDENGELLPPALQLGTGSVEVPIGIVFTAWKGRLGLNAQLLHQFSTPSQSVQFGDETHVNLAVGYRLTPKEYRSMQDKVVTAYLEVNTVVSGRSSAKGQPLPDSGATVLFLTPGLQWVLTPRLLVEAAFQIPVVQELNGTQLGFGPTANGGLRLLF